MDVEAARVILDDDTMACAFRGFGSLAGHLRGVEAAALWIKPGRHFNACFRLLQDGAADRFASAFGVGAARARRILAQIGGHRTHPGGASECVHCNSISAPPGLLLQFFPYDYRLPTLPRCLDAEAVGAATGIPISSARPVAYRPGRRCQIRYESNPLLYGKVAVEERPGRGFGLVEQAWHATASKNVSLVLPRPVRYVPELRLSLLQEVDGESLYAILRRGADRTPETATSMARGLAELHGFEPAAEVKSFTAAEEVELLRAWVGLVSDLFPEMAARLRECFVSLERSQPASLPGCAFVHRDFYDKQVLLQGGAIAILDLDTACRGDPEIDLGNFTAHLRLRALQWAPAALCREIEHRFLAGYPRRIDAERTDWYRRASLLRLACNYRFRRRWARLAAALIEAAMA